ncbi:Maf family nucleotide pyrophosphatase [Pleomorphovibrio marinus]|uniref:Maf family nucleotide pyrophosphatase n=1 Tax=Pleomorphovibrio marinus TaxID=2164132 RepID=UPI000E0C2E5A|nr:Maf family nucleotide pyrophosphatase [Pleomorphovibrio marinus]
MLKSFTNNLILASKSPRRKTLLEGLGVPFSVKTLPVDEDFPASMSLERVPEFLAEKKARVYQKELMNDEVVLTADTVVIVEGKILNKPRDKEEAFNMLNMLSGRMHHVITGVCLASYQHLYSASDTTKVYFRQLEADEISFYVENYSPFDKAGAYGIQEWIGYIGVEKIEGSFYTVMGLPLHLVYKMLEQSRF